MEILKTNKKLSFLLFLVLANLFVWYSAGSVKGSGVLTFAVMNVGQGDALFIEAPNGTTLIMDGGPDGSIMRELGKLLPAYKRDVDMLVVTNPDKDHYAGFLNVLDKYGVGAVLEPGTNSPGSLYAELEGIIRKKKIPEYLMRRGMKVWLDENAGVYLEILFPDQDVTNWTTNNGSMIAKLVYGETSVMLEGDAPLEDEKYLISLDGGAATSTLHADILKVGHHGSRTSTSPEYVKAVSPKYAVISAGVKNKFGHPHKETLDTLNKAGVEIVGTYDQGTIVFQSDGKSFILK